MQSKGISLNGYSLFYFVFIDIAKQQSRAWNPGSLEPREPG